MKYAVCLHSDDGKAFSALAPDIVGCYGAGASFDDALRDMESAIHAHFELLAEDQEDIPQASTLNAFVNDPDYEGGIWGYLDVDVTQYMGKATKVNVTLPGFLIQKIEKEISENSNYKNRSQFLAEAALNQIQKAW